MAMRIVVDGANVVGSVPDGCGYAKRK